jgi:hypothetical protein
MLSALLAFSTPAALLTLGAHLMYGILAAVAAIGMVKSAGFSSTVAKPTLSTWKRSLFLPPLQLMLAAPSPAVLTYRATTPDIHRPEKLEIGSPSCKNETYQ